MAETLASGSQLGLAKASNEEAETFYILSVCAGTINPKKYR
jgi:hypothetical protein